MRKKKTMESGWVRLDDERHFQQDKGKSRSEMHNDTKTVRCVSLNWFCVVYDTKAPSI